MTTKERVTELIERLPEDLLRRFNTTLNISTRNRNMKSGLGFHSLIWLRVMQPTKQSIHSKTLNDEAR